MNRFSIGRLLLLTAAAAAGAVAAALGVPKFRSAEAQLPAPSASAPVPVVLPRLQSVTNYVEITGNAAAVNDVKLVARVEGYLEQIHYQDGQSVKKGDLLFTIQQDQYKYQLLQAQGQVISAQAALTHANTELPRYSALVKKDAATQTQVDQWVYEKGSSTGSLLSARASVALDKLNLSYTEVRAPFDGIVGKHLIDPGNVVGGGGQQSALAEITQLDPIYVVANLSEQTVLKIRQNLGQHRLTLADLHKVPVDVGLSDEQGFPHRGTIEFVRTGARPVDRDLAGARHPAQPRLGAPARVFCAHAATDGQGRPQRPAGPPACVADRSGRDLSAGPERKRCRAAALCPARVDDGRIAGRHLRT